MRKIIYNAISAALANVQGIAHVGLWNNQLAYIEEEQPFDTPAVFIEFGQIDWKHQLHGVREAVITVRLHVVTDSRLSPWSEVVNVFDLLDQINATLHGLHSVTLPAGDPGSSVMDALTSIQSITDHDFGELQDNIEVYECHVTDGSGYSR